MLSSAIFAPVKKDGLSRICKHDVNFKNLPYIGEKSAPF